MSNSSAAGAAPLLDTIRRVLEAEKSPHELAADVLTAINESGTHRVVPVEEWQPASTGPWTRLGKYPAFVIVSNGKHIGVGFRAKSAYEGDPEWCMEGGEFIDPPVTHWRPLPAHPASQGDAT